LFRYLRTVYCIGYYTYKPVGDLTRDSAWFAVWCGRCL